MSLKTFLTCVALRMFRETFAMERGTKDRQPGWASDLGDGMEIAEEVKPRAIRMRSRRGEIMAFLVYGGTLWRGTVLRN